MGSGTIGFAIIIVPIISYLPLVYNGCSMFSHQKETVVESILLDGQEREDERDCDPPIA